MRKDWIQTLTNRKLTPADLKPEQVGGIEEIAHALAGKFRFTCQTRQRYSVAEHCVRGSQLVAPELALPFLLHELSEVYLPDIASPLKPLVFVRVEASPGNFVYMPWKELERRHTATILKALKLESFEPLIYAPEVAKMDLAMLAAEKRDLCGPPPEPWGIEGVPPACGTILPWSPNYAAEAFTRRFEELGS